MSSVLPHSALYISIITNILQTSSPYLQQLSDECTLIWEEIQFLPLIELPTICEYIEAYGMYIRHTFTTCYAITYLTIVSLIHDIRNVINSNAMTEAEA